MSALSVHERRKFPLQSKTYLYATAFFSGMSVMAVEIGASRLLAPYFSASQIVWTIIIGVIMIALALGNVWGGRLADRDPDPARLYRRLIVAALWIAAIPVLGKYVIAVVSGLLIVAIETNLLVTAAFISCAAIFVFPLLLLGTVTPSLVKYTVSSLDDSGKTVGTLGAANTVGSIIGTFVPTFLSIPAVGTAATFVIFSGILLLLGAVYFISVKRGAVKTVISLVLFAAASVAGLSFGFAFWENTLTLEDESVYNYLQVREDDTRVILSTNVLFGVQSVYQKSDTLTGMYYDYALAAPLMAEQPDSLLILGMGTGTYATQCARYFPDMTVEGVEIDEKITDLAHEYFRLDETVPVTTYDGRAYLASCGESYDVIMVDAYQDITIQFQMSSYEFFSMVRDHLTDNGVMVVNMNMRGGEEGSINDYLSDTIASVFPEVVTVDVANSTNRELFAGMNNSSFTKFASAAETIEDPRLSYMMALVEDNLVSYEGGNRILTDDKAPVELLGMQVIDELIKDEVQYYRDIVERDGISGLIGQL